MTDDNFQMMSQRLCRQLEATRSLELAKCVHVYWPNDVWKEPDIRPFIHFLLRLSVRIVLPVVRSFSGSPSFGSRMEQVEFTSKTKLTRNRWGIYEPDDTTFVSKSELDAVIVPALAVDRSGNRLGFGGGFYDEFLSDITVDILCPIFSPYVLDYIPIEKHDIPVQMIITEAGCIEANKT